MIIRVNNDVTLGPVVNPNMTSLLTLIIIGPSTSVGHLVTTEREGSNLLMYTGYAGCAITAGIPVKFGTTHGRCRPDVGSTKRIDVYGSGGVYRPYLVI